MKILKNHKRMKKSETTLPFETKKALEHQKTGANGK